MTKIIGSPGSYSASLTGHKKMSRLSTDGIIMIEKRLFSNDALDMMSALNSSGGTLAYCSVPSNYDENYGAAFKQHGGYANFMFGSGSIKSLKYGIRFGNTTWEPY
jgi:hypothetical protein